MKIFSIGPIEGPMNGLSMPRHKKPLLNDSKNRINEKIFHVFINKTHEVSPDHILHMEGQLVEIHHTSIFH